MRRQLLLPILYKARFLNHLVAIDLATPVVVVLETRAALAVIVAVVVDRADFRPYNMAFH